MMSKVSTEPLRQVLANNQIKPDVLKTHLSVLLNKYPKMDIDTESDLHLQLQFLRKFQKQEGGKFYVPSDQVLPLLEFLEQHLNNFSEEPIAEKDYQYLLADEIVDCIKNNLDTNKQSCEEEKDLSSEFKISDYYAAIPFRKDILQALVPEDIRPLLDSRRTSHYFGISSK